MLSIRANVRACRQFLERRQAEIGDDAPVFLGDRIAVSPSLGRRSADLDAFAVEIAHEIRSPALFHDFAVVPHDDPKISTFRANCKHKSSFDPPASACHPRRMGIGRRIAEVRQERGWSQAKLAAAVNQAQTTISSWERERTEPSRDDAARVAAALQVPIEALEAPGVATTALPQIALLPIRNRVQAGAWLAIDELAQEEPRPSSTIRDPRFPHADQWLSEVVGDSMNVLNILDGDLVHLVDFIGSGRYPTTGDIVEVERIRFQGAEREVTLKQVEVTGRETMLLWPRSTNPRWRDPVPVPGDVGGEEVEVRIRGLMINLVRRFAI